MKLLSKCIVLLALMVSTTTVTAAAVDQPHSILGAISETLEKIQSYLYAQVLGISISNTGDTVEVMAGRTTTLELDGNGPVTIVRQPEHGQVSANPDGTIALVLTRSDYTGPLDFTYRQGGSERTVNLNVVPGLQGDGWGTGENFYQLPVDSNNRVIVEPGERHRKVYIGVDGLTRADIAAREGMDESAVTTGWVSSSDYGRTEALALSEELGLGLWDRLNPRGSVGSHWLLFERGGTYSNGRLYPRDVSGESALAPLFIGAWGTGPKPILTDMPSLFQADMQHIVTQDIMFADGVRALGGHTNLLFDHVTISGEEAVFIGNANGMRNVTFRHSEIKDVWQDQSTVDSDLEKWPAIKSRQSGIYATKVRGMLFDNFFTTQTGFHPDFHPEGLTSGTHPPSMYSHAVYLQRSTRDVTVRDSLIMRGASFGSQLRGGGHIINTIYADNNIPFNLLGGGASLNGNYSLVLDTVVSSAARRGAQVPKIGALDWGMRNSARHTSLVDSIVTHANDPDDPNTTFPGRSSVRHGHEPFFDNTKIYRWGDTNTGIDGLSTSTLLTTTLPRLVSTQFDGSASIDGLADHFRSVATTNQFGPDINKAVAYFQSAFSVNRPSGANSLRFVPDERGDGVRFDNRLNWQENQIPTDGDQVDLAGNQAVHTQGDLSLDRLTFGANGELIVPSGRITIGAMQTSDTPGTVTLTNSGQFFFNGYRDTEGLTATLEGGRFANTGTVSGPVDMSVNGGQALLTLGAASFALDGTLTASGTASQVGFEGENDAAATFTVERDATVALIGDADGVPAIREFRSGYYGVDEPAVTSTIDISSQGTTLHVDLTDTPVAPGDSFTLVDADSLTGAFADHSIAGWERNGVTGATLTYANATGTVTLTLSDQTTGLTIETDAATAEPDEGDDRGRPADDERPDSDEEDASGDESARNENGQANRPSQADIKQGLARGRGTTTLRYRNVADLDGDGTPDEEQCNLGALVNQVRKDRERFNALSFGNVNSCIKRFRNRPTADFAEDSGYTYPLGLFEFTATVDPGATETVTVYLDEEYDTSGWTYRKYTGSEYIDISDRVTYGTASVDGETVTTVRYDVTDGGPLDTDGTVNGEIVDPAGPAETDSTTSSDGDDESDDSGSSDERETTDEEESGGSRSSSATRTNRTSDARSTDPSVSEPSRYLPVTNVSALQPQYNQPEDVRRTERFLNTFEDESLSVDGEYGSEDTAAIKRFQTKYAREILDIWDLDAPTGYVGITTRFKMQFLVNGQTAECPVFTEYNGGQSGITVSSEVGRTQEVLRELDFYTGPITNQWDTATEQALVRFQETFREVMLDPWNISEGTGYKYKTTNKFLNYLKGCDTDSVFLEGVGEYEGI